MLMRGTHTMGKRRNTSKGKLASGLLGCAVASGLAAASLGGVPTASATCIGISGINIGEGIRVFETFHGGRREVVGEGRANPLPFLLPAIALLKDTGHAATAQRILTAAEKVLGEGEMLTPNLGGAATTEQMTEAIHVAAAIRIVTFAPCLFGRHVGRRAENLAVLADGRLHRFPLG